MAAPHLPYRCDVGGAVAGYEATAGSCVDWCCLDGLRLLACASFSTILITTAEKMMPKGSTY